MYAMTFQSPFVLPVNVYQTLQTCFRFPHVRVLCIRNCSQGTAHTTATKTRVSSKQQLTMLHVSLPHCCCYCRAVKYGYRFTYMSAVYINNCVVVAMVTLCWVVVMVTVCKWALVSLGLCVAVNSILTVSSATRPCDLCVSFLFSLLYVHGGNICRMAQEVISFAVVSRSTWSWFGGKSPLVAPERS